MPRGSSQQEMRRISHTVSLSIFSFFYVEVLILCFRENLGHSRSVPNYTYILCFNCIRRWLCKTSGEYQYFQYMTNLREICFKIVKYGQKCLNVENLLNPQVKTSQIVIFENEIIVSFCGIDGETFIAFRLNMWKAIDKQHRLPRYVQNEIIWKWLECMPSSSRKYMNIQSTFK